MSHTPPLSGNTEVTVMLSSTANDQLSEFDIGFLGVTLTSQSGKTATLLSMPAPGIGAEFVQMNGTAEPLVTASIPQDVYTAATVTLNAAQFVCIELGPDNGQQVLDTSSYDDAGVSGSAVTVNLPSPITVTGASMALSLDLLAAQSAAYSACFTPNGVSSFSITPTFSLAPLNLASSPTNVENGKVIGLDGQITATGTASNTFTLSLPDAMGARSVSVTSGSNTVYQGVSNVSALAVGSFVDMDGTLQPDGSLLATRIAVEDPSAADTIGGPMIQVTPSVSTLLMLPRQQQGKDFLCCYQGGSIPVDFSTAAFQISGQLANLDNLPFVPTFNASNMVPGQNVYFSTSTYSWTVPRVTAATMTLMPQAIDGTVTASAQSGNFTDYTVTLAPYDLFPMLAAQPLQTNIENNPSHVEVYVDSNTQMLSQQSLGVGGTFRFYGLVFNDNGTLRMDCAQVNDGVAESSASNASSPLNVGERQTIRRLSPNGLPKLNTMVRGVR